MPSPSRLAIAAALTAVALLGLACATTPASPGAAAAPVAGAAADAAPAAATAPAPVAGAAPVAAAAPAPVAGAAPVAATAPAPVAGAAAAPSPIDGPTARRLVSQGALLLDVRSPAEFAEGHLDGATNVPVDELAARFPTLALPPGAEVVVYCRSGRRSAQAAAVLRGAGLTKVHDLGAMSRW